MVKSIQFPRDFFKNTLPWWKCSIDPKSGYYDTYEIHKKNVCDKCDQCFQRVEMSNPFWEYIQISGHYSRTLYLCDTCLKKYRDFENEYNDDDDDRKRYVSINVIPEDERGHYCVDLDGQMMYYWHRPRSELYRTYTTYEGYVINVTYEI